jgi:hypothetical protein
MLASCFLYEYYKRTCSKILYGIELPHVLRSLEAPLFSSINILIYMTPAYILGSFGNLKRNREYKVADKNVSIKVNKVELVNPS